MEDSVKIGLVSLTIIVGSFLVIQSTTPEVVVQNGYVISVNGKPVSRELGKWDFLEANIIYK